MSIHRLPVPFLSLLLLFALAACAGGPGGARVDFDWTHKLRADHPLVGRLYDPAAKSFVTEQVLLDRARAADHVLLGERHDNADHHRLQARIVQAIQAADRGRPIAMEMLTPDQGPAAATFLKLKPMDAAGFGEAVGWGKTGWPDWAIYRPIAEVALAFEAPLVPANLTAAEVRLLRREGPLGLDPVRRAKLDLIDEIPAPVMQAMADEIAAAHCGLVSAADAGPFVNVQWARDAVMAGAMQAADRSILIAGAGHVRKDRGVPIHLKPRQRGETILSIAFVEVSTDLTDPGVRDWPYDLVWFTPRVDETDACAKLRERMPPRS